MIKYGRYWLLFIVILVATNSYAQNAATKKNDVIISDVTQDYVLHGGWFIMPQIGWGSQQLNEGTDSDGITGVRAVMKPGDRDDSAGRIAAGYTVNKYVSFEGGVRFYSDAEFDFNVYTGPNAKTSMAKADTSAYAVDLLFDLTYIFPIKLFVIAKGGIAYVHFDSDVDKTRFNRTNVIPRLMSKYDGSESMLRPEAVVGLGYKITDKVSVTVTYSRIFGIQNNIDARNYIPDLDQGMVGVIYHFR